VSADVSSAAHRIWPRVLNHVRYRGQELESAAEILESAAHSVSRALNRRSSEPVRSLDSYLFWAFIRRYGRWLAKIRKVRYIGGTEVLDTRPANGDPVASRENSIQIDQVAAAMDPFLRAMLVRRLAGDSWGEIGSALGLSSHSAEVQFSAGLKKVRERLSKTGGNPIRDTGKSST
jgi:RNA polymerase sigma factor (sigma-70 family)